VSRELRFENSSTLFRPSIVTLAAVDADGRCRRRRALRQSARGERQVEWSRSWRGRRRRGGGGGGGRGSRRSSHLRGGQRGVERDVRELDDVVRMHHLKLACGGRHDPRRCLEPGNRELTLSVRALLEREGVLQRGQADLAVGEERLTDD